MCGVSVIWLALVFRKILRGWSLRDVVPTCASHRGSGIGHDWFFLSTDPAPGYPPGTLGTVTTVQGAIHLAFTILVVNMMALGLFVISRRFWNEPQFSGWATFSIVSGLLTFVFMTAFGVSNATHSGYPGLFRTLGHQHRYTVWGAPCSYLYGLERGLCVSMVR